jgi:hypothetical protein
MDPPPDMMVTSPGPMLCPLGLIWTHTGPVLGPYWTHLGQLGLILDPHGPIWERESERERERERDMGFSRAVVGAKAGPKWGPNPLSCVYIYIYMYETYKT